MNKPLGIAAEKAHEGRLSWRRARPEGGDPAPVLRTAGDADDLASVKLCDLADQTADRTRGTGHDDGVTVFQLSDVE